jgi:histidinol-phosphatase (PHP family)
MLHNHTCYSDGTDVPEKYVIEALRQGFSRLGFSDHSPLHFETSFALKTDKTREYCDTILELKSRYAGKIEILLGMEVDFIPGSPFNPQYFRDHYPLDYIIGSVHLVGNSNPENLWFIDGPKQELYDNGLQKQFKGDIRKAVTTYYHQLNELITTYKPDIVGHLDKIKMHNRDRYFREDEGWYVSLVDETLDLIRNSGCVVEVNTRGIYKKRSDSLFPGPEILKKLLKLNIPVTVTSDAHSPSEISLLLHETSVTLKEMGFNLPQFVFRNS